MGSAISYFVGVTFALIMIMFVIDLSVEKVALSEGLDAVDFFDYENSQMRGFDQDGNYTLTDDVAGFLPESTQNTNVEEEQGNFFTDLFGTMKDWLLDVSGVSFVLGIVNTLPNLLKFIFPGDLAPIAFALGYLWFGSFVASIIFWLKGGGT